MKLHFDGTTEHLGGGTVGWAQFSCILSYDESTLLEVYFCSKLIAYHLTPCFRKEQQPYLRARPWYLDLPEKDAMEFRLRFPCSHIPIEVLRKGTFKVFDEFSLDFVLEL